jgi:hypothetical protein
MLSQDDQRRLGDIERQLSLSDPAFAEGLRDGMPRRPTGDRRWPLIAGALGAVILLLIGLLVVNPFVITLGAAGVASAGLAYRAHVRKAHGCVPRVPPWKRW